MRKKLIKYTAAALCLVICCGLCACRGYREKKLNASFESFAENHEYLTVNQFMLNDIPVAEIYVDNGQIKPLVILLHGVMSSKEGMAENAAAFAEKNFHVVMIDAVSQGERADRYMMFPQMIVETGDDLNELIRYYSTVEGVDASKTGLVGFSMGSMITMWYIAYGDYPITAAITEVGTPDFTLITSESALNTRYKAYKTKAGNWSDEKFNAYMSENNPMNKAERFTGVALLMINGGKDDLIPYSGSESLYRYLKDTGSDVTFYLYTQSGHLDLPYDEVKPLETEFFCEKLK